MSNNLPRPAVRRTAGQSARARAELNLRALHHYIGYRKQLFVYALLAGGATAAFWLLFGAAAGDVLYALLLETAILAVIVIFDFWAVRRRLLALWEIRGRLAQYEQALPEGANEAERAYCAIAEGYRTRGAAQAEELTRMHAAAVEYMTLWMHQIKTPIAAMRLTLETEGAQRAPLERQLFEVERCAELALQYVRAADIAADLVLAPVQIEQVVRECVRKYAPLFIAKGLYAEVEPLGLAVVTDAKWFAFLFEQLLSNAVKYTSAGGVRVYARDGALYLEDTGCGIRPEDLPRVFEKGYTGGNGRLDRRASGIGLYLARRAAGTMNISLTLNSTFGKGTMAKITFPQCPPDVV